MERARSSALLKREVLPPERSEHGFGVLLVTSVGIFFAVMSSAFILQARAVRTCPATSGANEFSHPEPVQPGASLTPDDNALGMDDNALGVHAAMDGLGLADHDRPAVACGRPLYRANPDGSLSVSFQLCEEDMTLNLAPDSLPVPGIEIRRVIR